MLKLACVITNGYVDVTTLSHYMERGWTFVTTLPAKQVHPHALPTDKVTIFSKYTPYTAESDVPVGGGPDSRAE